ncbi:MAG: tyrosine recombinase XerD [Armatimonadota bacterium]|nr:MAG: tyrosine recombinase XerD [Armatimonadota bacterium]
MADSVPLVLLQGPVTVSEAVSDFLRHCRARGLSRSTVTLNEGVLSRLVEQAGELRLEQLSQKHLQSFLLQVSKGRKPSTVQRYYNALQAFGKHLRSLGHPDPAEGLPRPKAPRPVIEPLAQQEVEAMVASCPDTPLGRRDRLVLLLLVDCGLRASELAALRLDDVDTSECVLLVRCGKGGKPRRVPFGQTVAEALEDWLAVRGNVEAPQLIVNCYGQGVDRYRIGHIVRQAAERAGIRRRVGPHRLRHTCAVSYLRAGGDVFTLQRILGHADLTMTRRYTEVADTDVQEKHRLYSPADRLSVPSKTRKRVL